MEPHLHAIAQAIAQATNVHTGAIYDDLEAAINAKVDQRLASIGGQLLARHGEGSEDPNPILASVGGRLTSLGDG